MSKIRYIVPAVLTVFIIAARSNTQIGEWYAVTVYPHLSSFLSLSVSWIPFSMEEVLVIGAALFIFSIIVKGIRQKNKKAVLHIAETAAWLIIWFYFGWGMTYFREDIYLRGNIERQGFDEQTFKRFLKEYTDSLNGSYTYLPQEWDYPDFENDIKKSFTKVPETYGLCDPKPWHKPKVLIFNSLYSAVGVGGYVGPFFSEIQLNEDLLPSQKAFNYAHELSHLLGVSNEDEANFWAYLTCTSSESKAVRYSGYLSLLPYVLANASRVLDPEEYKECQKSIKPEILRQLIDQQNHWNSMYSKTLGAIQHKIYDSMLKGNKVSSGIRNYMQVIDLIIASEKGHPILSNAQNYKK